MLEPTVSLAFCVAFAGQILLLSLFFPMKVLRSARYVITHYPRAEYPKLYSASPEGVCRALRAYQAVNVFALLAGAGLLAHLLVSGGGELLSWNNGSVVAMFGLLQLAPLAIVSFSGFAYFNLKRKPDSGPTRKAQLKPRRLFDFVSPVLLGVAAFVYLAFVIFIVYVDQFGFSWFGGYLNVVGVTGMNALFALFGMRVLRGKRHDPYQSYEDRQRQIAFETTALVWWSILATSFIVLSIAVRALELADLGPVLQSLFFQVIALFSLRAFRINQVDFDVYREEPAH